MKHIIELIIGILRTIFFSEMAYEETSPKIRKEYGVVSFILVSAIFVLPLDESSRKAFFYNFLVETIVLFLVFFVVYLFISIMKFRFFNILNFFKNVSFYFLISLVVVFLPALFFSQFIVFKFFHNALLGQFIFTFFTYYAFILFGWLSEKASGEKGFKGTIIALFAITMISIMFFNLGNFTR
jgi:hypothetical protein